MTSPELATDGGTKLGVLCDVDDCGNRIVGLDDGWEFSRGTVCQDCIDYQSRHGHWPDESVDICAECRIDDGMIPHECEESSADRVLIEPGTTCDYCGFEAAVTDGGQPAEDGQEVKHVLAETQVAGFGMANGKVVERLLIEFDRETPAAKLVHDRLDYAEPLRDRDPKLETLKEIVANPHDSHRNGEQKLETGSGYGKDRVIVDRHGHARRIYIRHEHYENGEWNEAAAWELHPATGVEEFGGDLVTDGGEEVGQELTGDAATTEACPNETSTPASGEHGQRSGSVTTATEHSTRQPTSTSTETAATSATSAKSSSLIPDGGEEVGRAVAQNASVDDSLTFGDADPTLTSLEDVHLDSTLVLVGCGASKRDPADPTDRHLASVPEGEDVPGYGTGPAWPAEDLYTSTYFAVKREFAEVVTAWANSQDATPWAVLSAEHGILPHWQDVPRYDTTIDDLGDDPENPDHHVESSIVRRRPDGREIVTEMDLWATNVAYGLARWLSGYRDRGDEALTSRVNSLLVLAGQDYIQPLRERGVFTYGISRMAGDPNENLAHLDADVRFLFEEIDAEGIGEQMGWLSDTVDTLEPLVNDVEETEQDTLVTDGGQPAEDGREIPQAPNILLSIEPEHAEAILDGRKRWEYRRVAPASDPPYRFVLYASAPVQAAVGVAWCHTKKTEVPENCVLNTVVHTPHDPEDVLDYFGDVDEGHPLRIAAYRRFETPVPREDLEAMGAAPSQNFRYIGEVDAHAPAVEPAGVLPE